MRNITTSESLNNYHFGKSLDSKSSQLVDERITEADLVVFSHLRWDFVFQRPQHLCTRFAKTRRVFYMEEPQFDSEVPYMEVSRRQPQLSLLIPHLPATYSEEKRNLLLKKLVNEAFEELKIQDFISWYYTPMALNFTRHLKPLLIAYDCMDELSLFKNAHPELKKLENELFMLAHVVFTGGHSLYEHKKSQHQNIHPFPSSIDVAHFKKARHISPSEEGPDQRAIGPKKIGFFGVIDERMDLSLIDGIAKKRPDWNLVMIGPVTKIDVNSLPKSKNIHYLGNKTYQELPNYVGAWDVALLPFAKNPSTRFISPTKTPEYLAAGRPVVSTSIQDVVKPYHEKALVSIADSVEEYVRAIDRYFNRNKHEKLEWLERVDQFLSSKSWDRTWAEMAQLMNLSYSNGMAKNLAAAQSA